MTLHGLAAIGAFAVAACCAGTASVVAPAPDLPDAQVTTDDVADLAPDPAAMDEAPLEERIAAIERGMNDLAPVANQCWAAAAADNFRLSGDVRLLVAIATPPESKAQVDLVDDSTGDDVLTRCLSAVAAEYRWAPPLRGQKIELPFHFIAPAMQNVIDTRFVPRRAQAGIEIGVLIDDINTGNPALSLIDAKFADKAVSGPREVERTEIWLFFAAATVTPMGGKSREVAAGDVMLAPAGSRLTVSASAPEVHALVALIPGGAEGTARAGALPGPRPSVAVQARPVTPVFITPAKAKRYLRPGGATTFAIEPPLAGGAVSATFLEIDAGVVVPPHVHAKETEVLYLLAGGGTMTVGGAMVPVTEHSVVQIPPGVEHGFVATSATRAVQFYAPAGPEQRFKKKLKKKQR